jgi:hypothetical protein
MGGIGYRGGGNPATAAAMGYEIRYPPVGPRRSLMGRRGKTSGDDKREGAVDKARAAEPEPGFLDGVVGLAD